MRFHRYQLNKTTSRVLLNGHPWIFRNQISTAAEVFGSGDWLELVDSSNQTIGFGLYESAGLIGIRVFRIGKEKPDSRWLESVIQTALKKREQLRKFTNAFRVVHGENDGLPGIVIDVYGGSIVLQTYATGLDPLGRAAAGFVARELGLANIIFKTPAKRQSKTQDRSTRILRGIVPPLEFVYEGKFHYKVDLLTGQKSGLFLDLRHLRKWVGQSKLAGKRVLNLFAYTGTLGLAAEKAGAKEVWNVDVSQGALDFGKKHHDPGKINVRWIKADIFEWIRNLDPQEKFDLIIFDPPNVAADKSQVQESLAVYRRMYAKLRDHVEKNGALVACCCTSRIERGHFKTCVENGLQQRLKFEKSLLPEDDHPVGFPEGDYLKVFIYREGLR